MAHEILDQIIKICGHNHVISDHKNQTPYITDWRKRYVGESLAVIKPQTPQQIVQLIDLCQKYKISIIPQGGNTSLCGGSVPLSISDTPQIVINLSLLNQILDIDIKNNSITVEAGCTLEQIINYAQLHNRYFPLHIASLGSCQIGGNIATNAGGINVIKYGMLRDLILGLEVILPNGDKIDQLNTLRKNNTYLDLKQFFIGSEGTLGIITKAVLRLFPMPKGYITGLIAVQSISKAIKLLNQLMHDFEVNAYEIIGKNICDIYNQVFPSDTIPISANWLILFELEENNLDQVLEVIANYPINHQELILNDNTTSRQKLWKIRENMPLAEKAYGIAIKHDISLPISQIENFIQQNQINFQKHYPNAQIIVFGHLGDGNLHYNIQLGSNEETLANEAQINQIVYNDVIALNGSISAEHGIGQLKAHWFKNTSQAESYTLAKQLKNLIDPHSIFNPNKVFT